MRFHLLTIFPGLFDSPFSEGVVKRAVNKGLMEINVTDIRAFAYDKHGTVDDYVFGGGPGMLMKPEPLFEAVTAVKSNSRLDDSVPVVLMTPQGRRLNHNIVEQMSLNKDIIVICGRYEGFDERVRLHLATEEISVGDYVLGGGEIAAMLLVEAVSRLIPGAVGREESTRSDSFATGILQHPEYTRPANYRGWKVPSVLLSGDHTKIARWRRLESLKRTFNRRPDLLDAVELTEEEEHFLRNSPDCN